MKNTENKSTTNELLIDVNDTCSCSICYGKCDNVKTVILESENLSGVGRFLNLSATVKNVCPKKLIALGLKIYETTSGKKVMKGYKMFSASHNQPCCADITFSNIHFVFPEEIAESCKKCDICNRRTFEIETITHYVNFGD